MITEDYICDACGNATPIPSDVCPSCGQAMKADKPPSAPTLHGKTDSLSDPAEELEDDDSPIDDSAHQDGTESLEALQDEEEQEEAEDSYGQEQD